MEAAESDDVEVCRAALIGLGIARHASGLPTITKAARSKDPTKRLIAAAALSNFDDPSVLPLLLSAAADDVETVRTSAVGFIASRSGAETASALIGLLQLPEPPAWVVPALATPIAGRVSSILAALETADESVAGHLVSALARMGTPEASSALVTVMSRAAVPARKVAATALGALRTKDAVETLRRVAVNDSDAEVRRIASLLLPG
jgi:HEAT repeat protein